MNRKSLLRNVLILACWCFSASSALAIDTDLFIRDPADEGTPNVLVLIGNSAEWNSQLQSGRTVQDVIQQAVYKVVRGIDINTVNLNIGFMGYTVSGFEDPDGGKVHQSVRLLDADYQEELLSSYIYKYSFAEGYAIAVTPGAADPDGDGVFGDYDSDGDEFDAADIAAQCGGAGMDPDLDGDAGDADCDGDEFDDDDFSTHFTRMSSGAVKGNLEQSGQSTALAKSFVEAYEYFGARKPRSGVQQDPGLCGAKCPADENFFDEDAWDSVTELYNTPIDLVANECAANFIILVSNGEPSPAKTDGSKSARYYDDSSTASAEQLLEEAGGNTTEIPYGSDDFFSAHLANEWARFLATTDVYDDDGDGILGSENDPDEIDQSVITFVIDVFNPDDAGKGQHDDARAFMQSVGSSGLGGYFDVTNADELEEAFDDVFSLIAARNTVFASTALPVSVNVRGTNLNQIYLGVFRADANNQPRWYGNLKAYKLGLDYSFDPPRPTLVDSQDEQARDESSGFIRATAVSHWTEDEATDFWTFNPSLYPNPSDSPDGDIVEKGAAGQQMRKNFGADGSSRNVYTCVDNCASGVSPALSTTPFDTTLANSHKIAMCDLDDADTTDGVLDPNNALGDPNDCDADTLIAWFRGQDQNNSSGTDGDEDGDTNVQEVRSSIHGDVLHSRPAIFNYNRSGNDDDVVLYYGTNGGTLEALQGGLSDPTDSTGGDGGTAGPLPAAGTELWAFIPEEHFGKLSQLYENEDLPTLADGSATTIDREIYFDGSFSLFAEEAVGHVDNEYHAADGDKVYLFATARRGGGVIYAFDVSDPEAPELLWRKRGTDSVLGTTADGGFEELGQTWSEAKVAKISLDTDGNGTGETRDVLIFGKGYDAEDTTCPDGTEIGPDDYVPDADNDPTLLTCTDNLGTGVLVLDMETGYPIWQVGPDRTAFDAATLPSSPFTTLTATYKVQSDMIHSMPADVVLVDRERDGVSEKLYIADTGGQVWRIDFNTSISEWAVNKLANLGNHFDGNGTPDDTQDLTASGLSNAEDVNLQANDRRFLFPADVVIATPGDTRGEFDAVLIGSGNREEPDEEVTQDRFYMIKDHETGQLTNTAGTPSGWPYTDTPGDDPDTPAGGVTVDNTDADTTNDAEDFLEGDFYDATDNFIGSDNSVTALNAQLLLDAAEGWYIDLLVGEKVVSSAVTLAGTTFFNTNQNTVSDVCAADLGTARSYAVDFFDASPSVDFDDDGDLDRSMIVSGGGFPPSPVPFTVELGGGIITGVQVGPLSLPAPAAAIGVREKVFWYQEIDD